MPEVLDHNADKGMKRVWKLREEGLQYVTYLDATYRKLSENGDAADVAGILDKPMYTGSWSYSHIPYQCSVMSGTYRSFYLRGPSGHTSR